MTDFAEPVGTRRARFAAPLRALVRKDLRLVMPVAVGFAALTAFGCLQELLFEPASKSTFVGPDSWGSSEGFALAGFAALIALLGAMVLLPGERDARTAEFVATLPVDVRLVVGCKLMVVASLCVGLLWLDMLADLLLSLLVNSEPMALRALTPGTIGLRFGLVAIVGLTWTAHASWLSSYGRLGWVILALLVTATSVLGQLDPRLAPLRLDGLMRVHHHGTTPLLPLRALLVQGALAALTLSLGLRRWTRLHGQPPRLSSATEGAGSRRARLGPPLLLLGLFLLIALGVIVSRQGGGDDDAPEAATAVAEPAATDVLATRHFRFTFLPEDAATARTLADAADGLYRKVARHLGVEVRERIVVDLTYAGVDAAGLALGQQVNVDVSGDKSAAKVQRIFVHELVHVFETALSPRARLDQRASLRFAAEGFAEYVTYAVLGLDDERASGRLAAAWGRKRYRLRLSDLYDTGRFLADYDERWLYDFGERFIAALAQSCGPTAPARMFAGLDDPALPASLLGAALTRDLLARTRCDLDQVEAAFESDLAALAPALAAVPRFRARFRHSDGGSFTFDVRVDGPAGTPGAVPVSLLLRADATTSPRDFVVVEQQVALGATQSISVDAPALDARSFQYRLGLQLPSGRFVTRWRSARAAQE
jgi:hypothetical protein